MSYLSASLGFTTTLSITPITLIVSLEDSPPLQVYQWRKKIIIDLDKLPPHESNSSTEVFELHIALRKGSCSYTHHPINKVLSFSYLSPIYFNFATKLFFVSLPKSYHDAMLDPGWKSAMNEEMTTLQANETYKKLLYHQNSRWLSMDIHYQISL